MDPQRVRPLARQPLLRDGDIIAIDEFTRRFRQMADALQLQYADSRRMDIQLTTWISYLGGFLNVEVGYHASDQSTLPFDATTEKPVGEALDDLVQIAPEATAMRHMQISKAVVDGNLDALDARDRRYIKKSAGKRKEIRFADGNQLQLIPRVNDLERGRCTEYEARVVSIGAYTIELRHIQRIQEDGLRVATTRRKYSRRPIPMDLGTVDFDVRTHARQSAVTSLETEADASPQRFRFWAVSFQLRSTGELVSLALQAPPAVDDAT